MRNMTRPGHAADIATPFDGRVFTFKEETARLFERDNERMLEIDSSRTGEVTYRVTKVIGGRYREDFAGVPISGEVPDIPEGSEWILPVSYVIATDSLRYKGYSVPVKERPGLHVSAQWNQTCVFCHNTSPKLVRSWGDVIDGAPGYQANFIDQRLPTDAQWSHVITDRERFEEETRSEVAYVTGRQIEADGEELVRQAAVGFRHSLRDEHVVDVGIGCEACHNGSAQHVENPRKYRPTFELRSDFMVHRPDDGHEPTQAELLNRTCAQCHSVLFSRYPFTWEGGSRTRNPQGSVMNSGEARDFLLGACSSQMSCASCHDPHRRDEPAQMRRLRTVEGNDVCTDCHTQLGDDSALAAHTHHQVDNDGSACINCHMPRKNLGLNTNLTAYHRIGSPTETRRVENDRPLECALCHVDSSVGALVSTMEQWWGKSYDRKRLQSLYGALSSPAATSTLARGKMHEQVVGIHMLRSSNHPKRDELLAPMLTHDIPYVRYHALEALTDITGERPPIDLHQDVSKIDAEVRVWLEGLDSSKPR